MSFGWVLRNLIAVSAGTIICLIFLTKDARAHLPHEVRSGDFEIGSVQDGSLVVKNVPVDKQKKSINFSVSEAKIIQPK